MKVNIDEIQKITFLLLSKLKDNIGNEVEISNDYYWNIPNEELFNPYEQPKGLTLGQMADDIEEVQRLLEYDNPIIYDLKRIASILTAITIEHPIAF